MQPNRKEPLIAFTGGGTGGHVYPALALIEELKSRGYHNFLWIGSRRGIERKIVEGWKIPFAAVSSGKLRRYFDVRNFFDVFKILWGFIQSFFLLWRFKPDFLVSKGGFVSVPPVYAAGLHKVPVFSHDSDLDPGLATRLNLRFSRLVFTAYPESAAFFPTSRQSKIRSFGNPVRRAFAEADAGWIRENWKLSPQVPVVLVMGGSLGARQLNDLVTALLPKLEGKAFVLHQTGDGYDPPEATAWYEARPYFHEEIAQVMAGADVLVTRAGAGALWEASAVGAALILVPLREGSRGDQVRNAEVFAQRGAALVLDPVHPTPEDLEALLLPLLENPLRRKELQKQVRTFEPESSARRICEAILENLK